MDQYISSRVLWWGHQHILAPRKGIQPQWEWSGVDMTILSERIEPEQFVEKIPAVTESGTVLENCPYQASMMTKKTSASPTHKTQRTFQPLLVVTTPGHGSSSPSCFWHQSIKPALSLFVISKHALIMKQSTCNTQICPAALFKPHFTATLASRRCPFTCTRGLKLAAGCGKRWHRV